MRFLVDTNVLSELAKDAPDPNATAWFSAHLNDDLFISSITVGEIAYGIEVMDKGKRKAEYSDWFESVLLEWFAGRIVTLDEEVMLVWAKLRAAARSLPVLDSLIAASALTLGCTLITRNTKDFEGIAGLAVINPWTD